MSKALLEEDKEYDGAGSGSAPDEEEEEGAAPAKKRSGRSGPSGAGSSSAAQGGGGEGDKDAGADDGHVDEFEEGDDDSGDDEEGAEAGDGSTTARLSCMHGERNNDAVLSKWSFTHRTRTAFNLRRRTHYGLTGEGVYCHSYHYDADSRRHVVGNKPDAADKLVDESAAIKTFIDAARDCYHDMQPKLVENEASVPLDEEMVALLKKEIASFEAGSRGNTVDAYEGKVLGDADALADEGEEGGEEEEEELEEDGGEDAGEDGGEGDGGEDGGEDSGEGDGGEDAAEEEEDDDDDDDDDGEKIQRCAAAPTTARTPLLRTRPLHLPTFHLTSICCVPRAGWRANSIGGSRSWRCPGMTLVQALRRPSQPGSRRTARAREPSASSARPQTSRGIDRAQRRQTWRSRLGGCAWTVRGVGGGTAR